MLLSKLSHKLVDGNPLDDLELIADPEKNFLVIMKDGKVYKNSVR